MAWKIGLKRMIEATAAGSSIYRREDAGQDGQRRQDEDEGRRQMVPLVAPQPDQNAGQRHHQRGSAAKTGRAQGSAGHIGHTSIAPASTTPPVTRPLTAPAKA